MTCIDEYLLQKYIDSECADNEMAEVKQHLSGCPECTCKLLEREKLSAGIKGAISSLTIENIDIPRFRKSKISSSKKNIILIIYSLSAACILLFVLFSVNEKNDSHQMEMTVVQSVTGEIDANRPASDQDFVIEVFDGKGNLSEYLIE